MNRLMEYLPSFYHDIFEFAELTDTESKEILTVQQAIDRLFDNQFVMTSDERAVKRREQILGIQADPKTETLEFRKKRLINRYSTKPPFTVRYLQKQLDYLVGLGRVIVSVDAKSFLLTVTANIDDAAVFKEVERTVRVVKPANITYQQKTSLEAKIIFNERISKQALTRQTRLSTNWKLGVTPFATAEPEVRIK